MKKRYILIFVLLILAFYLLVHSTASTQKQISRDLAVQRQGQELRLMVASLETFLSSAAYGLNALPQFPAVQRGSDPDCLRDMDVLFPDNRETSAHHLPPHQFHSLRRVAPDGEVRYYLSHDSRTLPAGEKLDYLDNPAVQGATRTGKLFLSDPEYAEDGSLVLWMAAPVFETIRDDRNPTAKGEFSGVILAELDAAKMFEQFVASMRSSDEDCLVVVNRQSGSLIYSSKDSQQVGEAWNSSCCRPDSLESNHFQRLRNRIFSGAWGVDEFVDISGNMQLVSFFPLEIANQAWSLVREVPRAQTGQALAAFNDRVLLISAAALLAMLTCFVLIGRSQQQRIRAQEKELILRDLEQQVEERTRVLFQQTEELESTYRALQHETRSLEASRQEYRMLVEGVDFGLMRITPRGEIQFSNDAAYLLTGGVCEKGKNLLDLPQLTDESRHRLSSALGEIRHSGQAEALSIELELPKKGLRSFNIEINPLRVAQQLVACLVHLRPVTKGEGSSDL